MLNLKVCVSYEFEVNMTYKEWNNMDENEKLSFVDDNIDCIGGKIEIVEVSEF